MKVLFIFDDQKESTFYLYDLKDGKNQLLRFSPEILIREKTLGQLFVEHPIEKFMAYFNVAFEITVEKYLVMKKSEGLAAVKESGLDNAGFFQVENPTSFTALQNGRHYDSGTLFLTMTEVAAYISWQIDDDGTFGVFTRQEDVIRLMKKKLLKPRLSTITKNIGNVNSHIQTNLGIKDMLKLGQGYLAKGDDRMAKTTLPAAGTYQLAGDFPYRITAIDWQNNPIQLHPELR